MKFNKRIVLFPLVLAIIGLTALYLSGLNYQHHYIVAKGINCSKAQETCPQRLPEPAGIRILSDGREVHHIAFLKIHKAASGTASSIFFRFGFTRELTFVLPRSLNMIGTSETISEKLIHPRLNKPFDIMTSHVIYNRSAFERFLHNDTVYIGILRDPYEQFKSSMNYMAPQYVYNISDIDPIQLYLRNPLKYENSRSPRDSWINNRQAAEFGTPDDIIINKNITAMKEYVEKIDKEFHLVIITEYFDESIILLKRMLNWKLQDVLYRKLHIRGWDHELTLPKPYDRLLYRKYAFADYTLYDYFFKRLWQQANQVGVGFPEEVLYFKKVKEEVNDFCKVYPNISDEYIVPQSTWNEQFKVNIDTCRMIMWEEEDWVKLIGYRQYKLN